MGLMALTESTAERLITDQEVVVQHLYLLCTRTGQVKAVCLFLIFIVRTVQFESGAQTDDQSCVDCGAFKCSFYW